MSLPPCFVPTDDVALVLHRVQKGHDVAWVDAQPLIAVGLLRFDHEADRSSDYTITEDGLTAWQRWVDGVVDEARGLA